MHDITCYSNSRPDSLVNFPLFCPLFPFPYHTLSLSSPSLPPPLLLFSPKNFVTDLAATSGHVKDISNEAEKMVKAGHSQARAIQSR